MSQLCKRALLCCARPTPCNQRSLNAFVDTRAGEHTAEVSAWDTLGIQITRSQDTCPFRELEDLADAVLLHGCMLRILGDYQHSARFWNRRTVNGYLCLGKRRVVCLRNL